MAFRLHKNLHSNLLADWKFLLSFRKRDWLLEDYPVIVRKQFDSSRQLCNEVQWKMPAYHARIVNWLLSGSGDTAAAAMENLRETFNRAREERPSMPRPGTRVPLKFASQERIASNPAMTQEFIQSVLELDEAWLSDESSLWHFSLGHSLDDYHAKIRSLYGVDVSDIPDGNLADILERIVQSRK